MSGREWLRGALRGAPKEHGDAMTQQANLLQSFLKTYGYLREGHENNMESVGEAIKNMQLFGGLETTGPFFLFFFFSFFFLFFLFLFFTFFLLKFFSHPLFYLFFIKFF